MAVEDVSMNEDHCKLCRVQTLDYSVNNQKVLFIWGITLTSVLTSGKTHKSTEKCVDVTFRTCLTKNNCHSATLMDDGRFTGFVVSDLQS